MNNQPNIIDWSSPDVLLEIITHIKYPLTAIMNANKGVAEQLFGTVATPEVSTITLENSQKIADLIEEVIRKITAKKKEEPLFFEIYRKNPQVQKMCSQEVDASKISKTDKQWLLDLEKVVLNEPNPDQLSLFAVAFEVSVSERQLHRNIKKFLKMTPNKYIRILKLHRAKKLIEDYAYRTISEVAYAVGFNDAHYFSTLFYKQYGAMPKDMLPG